MELAVRTLTGEALRAALPDLARLRVAVFRDWPYLYDGDAEYEARYLRDWARSDGAALIGVFDETAMVGAATATLMEDAAPEFAEPFRRLGWPLEEILYLGESVLLPERRGQGLGHAFFDAREAHGRALGRRRAVFCAVLRAPDDPRRPPGYSPLDPFWRKRGYAPLDIETSFDWRELGAAEESPHRMRFWARRL